MFEVIPNWHPLFVHFTVSTLSLATVFYILAYALRNNGSYEKIKTFADWNCWLGSGFAVVTAIAGWFAYNSVAHDTPSHEAMTDHRNWALATLALFAVVAIWSFLRKRADKKVNVVFLIVVLLAFTLLGSAAWRGGEVVYRYGLGVMSLPVAEEGSDGHDHEHATGSGHDKKSYVEAIPMVGNDETSSQHDDISDHGNHKH